MTNGLLGQVKSLTISGQVWIAPLHSYSTSLLGNSTQSMSCSAAQKGYNIRRTGYKVTFIPNDNLNILKMLFGNTSRTPSRIDSIAKLSRPTLNDTKMTSIVKTHAKNTLQSAKLSPEV